MSTSDAPDAYSIGEGWGNTAAEARQGESLGQLLAGMNVNVWDQTDAIQALVRSGAPVDQSRRWSTPGCPLLTSPLTHQYRQEQRDEQHRDKHGPT